MRRLQPAAQRQLEILAEAAGVSFFALSDKTPPEVIAKKGLEKAVASAHDIVILDTAGRLQVDDEMMREAKRIREATLPRERLLVVDAMTGQEAQETPRYSMKSDATGVGHH